ncbi:MAG: site-2 protease family protein [Acidobacteriota bacterium]|nr:site-2 protease family protein [Acidobacteriota bacterium]
MSSPDPNLPPAFSLDDLRLHQVYVITPPRRRWWLHILLFVATVFTTLVMGARLEYNFLNQLPPFRFDHDLFPVRWALSDPHNLLLGIPFSVTLLTILLAHEFGHFLYCLRYRVYATLPFFIPAPTLIGTFGAFIRIKSPIPTRRALFDIGIAGPIAGFVIAVPAAVLGLLLSKHAAGLVGESDLQFGYPLIFHLLHAVLPWPVTGAMAASLDDLYMHPIALAAWVGMFATALNLLPGGQLDGGHIVYALAPEQHRRITRALTLLLIPLAILFWQGWFMWALFLLIMGSRHPQVSLYPALDGKRQLLAAFALLMLVLTLVPAPFAGGSALDAWDAYTQQR